MDDHVRISAPKYVSSKQLKELLSAKQEWILTQWLASRNTLRSPKRQYIAGALFPYRGQSLELSIRREPHQSTQVSAEGQVLVVSLPYNLLDYQCVDIQDSIMAWYKVEARRVLQSKLKEQAKKMQVTYREFRLKDQKTRWGSCSNQGNINLNWRIIMAPEEVIDYLVIHELAHLTQPNHSEKFWQRVGTFMPDYVRRRNWLRDHGQELVL
jgi:Predicted metal-dependent hydrolase